MMTRLLLPGLKPCSPFLYSMLVVGTLAATGLTSTAVHARSTRVVQIPSAPNNCGTCHVGMEFDMRNEFGQDVEASLDGLPIENADVAWMTVCNLDSDGDGESNGAELGDPCCDWTSGDAELEGNSLPADDTSTSGNTCVDGVATAPVELPIEQPPGGCPLGGGSSASLAGFGLGSLALWRRRRLL